MQVIIPIWKEAPFIRLIIPLAAGIVVQWYTNLPAWVLFLTLLTCTAFTIVFGFFQTFTRYRFYHFAGVFINLLLLALGATLVIFHSYGSNPEVVADGTFQNKIHLVSI